jgi:heterodisulfide reductase subunit A-like polyferredoxin
VKQSALVVGGGIAGITSALELANNSFEVYLVEREATLGGKLPLSVAKQRMFALNAPFALSHKILEK